MQNSKDTESNDNAIIFRKDNKGIDVPSRWTILKLLLANAGYMQLDQIAQLCQLKEKPQLHGLERRVSKLHDMGLIKASKKKGYALNHKVSLIIGRVQGTSKGYGFLVPQGERSKKGQDVYLHASQMRRVLDGDNVLIVVYKDKRQKKNAKEEGRVLELISEEARQFVGEVIKRDGQYYLQTQNSALPPILINDDKSQLDFELEDIVVVELINHPISGQQPVARVKQNLGHSASADMPVQRAIFEHEIPYEWPQNVVEQLSQEQELNSQSAVKINEQRRDLRELPLVTIDGADARDFDDAVYCEDMGKQWRVVVAIADVSHYVKVDSALDKQAIKRGNSVYFPNYVVPMLPKELSNGICSLNPDEDRYCMVCDMIINKQGEKQSYEFYPAVMRSQARLTYEQVEDMLVNGDQNLQQAWSHVMDNLQNLYSLYQKLTYKRQQRGSINFSFPEPLIEYDGDKRISAIKIKQRKQSHQLIEECMLLANVCAAEFLNEAFQHNTIYRNHPLPDIDSLEKVRAQLAPFGLSLKGGEHPHAKDYAAVIKQIEDKPHLNQFVQMLLLRSFSQAEYSCETQGHFALSYPLYTHFTSPIRRYTDLIVHRQIKAVLERNKKRQITPQGYSLTACAEQCSFTERRADDATRDVINWLKAEFMQDKLMQEFDAVITGVTDFGVFVQLQELFVDGLVHISTLGDDYYDFDDTHYQLIGRRSGVKYRLGDAMRVQLVGVDMETSNIDFAMISDEA